MADRNDRNGKKSLYPDYFLEVGTALIEGKPRRIKVSARAIRQGLVVKPLKRKYAYTRKQAQGDG